MQYDLKPVRRKQNEPMQAGMWRQKARRLGIPKFVFAMASRFESRADDDAEDRNFSTHRIETTRAQYNLIAFFINKSTKQRADTTANHDTDLRVTIFLGSEHEKIHDALRVTPFIVVPCDELDKVLVQLDSGVGIEDARCRIADEVSRDNRVFRVSQNSPKRTIGAFFDCPLDLVIAGLLL